MAQMHPCPFCDPPGSGQHEGGTCPRCSGTAEVRADWIRIGILGRENITDRLNDIMDKCNDIFEKVNE